MKLDWASRPWVLNWRKPAGGGDFAASREDKLAGMLGDDVCSRCVISGAMEAGGAVRGRKNESGNCRRSGVNTRESQSTFQNLESRMLTAFSGRGACDS